MGSDKLKDLCQLVRRVRSGDNKAFQTLIEQYQRLVCHIVFRIVSNAEEREDLCQDVFVKVYQNLDGFKFESKMSTWIAKITYNTCLNYLQKKKISLYSDFAPEGSSLDDVPAISDLPDAETERKDVSRRLLDEIESLNVCSRTILTLYHLEEMSYAEIGQIMNLPEGTVKSYLFRARRRLREKLETKYRREELWDATT